MNQTKYIKNTHTHKYGGKMADEVSQNIEDALNTIVNSTDQNGNLRKDLKKTIVESVSTLRNLFHKMKEILN
jgi:Lon protease-like protein